MIQREYLSEPLATRRERLLFQVSEYDHGTQSHGRRPGGLLYFVISEEDLAHRRFDRVLFEMQCT